MGINIGNLGAFAGGLTGGLERGMEIDARKQRLDHESRRLARQERLDERAEKELHKLEAANAAGVEAFEMMRRQHQGPGPFQPTPDQILSVRQARTNKLFEQGSTQEAAKAWAEDEAMRLELRRRAVEKHLPAFQLNGDPSDLLTSVFGYIDNGKTIVGRATPGKEGDREVFSVDVKDDATGKVERMSIPKDAIEQTVMGALDPKSSAAFWRMRIEGIKAEARESAAEAAHKRRLVEIDARGDKQLENTRLRIAGTITATQIREQGKDRRGSAGGGGGGGGGGSKVHSKTVLADGRVMLTMRDGTNRIATDDQGKPMTAIDFEKLVGSTAGQVGKTIDGSLATPEANRDRARAMLPKPPPATRPSLADFDATKPRPPLDAFQR